MQIKNLRKEAKLMCILDLLKLNNNNKQATTNDNSKKAIDRHKVEPAIIDKFQKISKFCTVRKRVDS